MVWGTVLMEHHRSEAQVEKEVVGMIFDVVVDDKFFLRLNNGDLETSLQSWQNF